MNLATAMALLPPSRFGWDNNRSILPSNDVGIESQGISWLNYYAAFSKNFTKQIIKYTEEEKVIFKEYLYMLPSNDLDPIIYLSTSLMVDQDMNKRF